MQISELRLYDVHERDITESRSRFVCGSSRAVRGEEPSRAVDGKVSVKNKWCDRSPQFGEVSNLWLRLDFPRPQEVMYYAWWTADDRGGAGHQRDPVSWRMQGSDNGIDWTDLDVRTDYDVPTNRCFRVGPFGCPHPAIDNLGAVDPFMGTGPDLHDRPGDCGMSHPGARVPFGMTQILADLPRRDSSNYMFTDPRTEGISCMRLNGVGYYGDLGTFLVRPTVDCRDTFASRAISDFTHESETAEPGYYATFLKRFGVYAEVTATKRGAMMRLTYPATDKADLCIDLARRIGLKSSWSRESRQTARVVGDDRLEGEMFYSMKDGGWGRGEGKCQYRLFFLCEFSKPLTDVLFYDGNAPKPGLTEYSGSNTVFTTRFKALPEEPVLLKVAFSYVDAEGARKNFKEDFPEAGFAFEHVRQAAKEEWRRDLNVVQVEGGTPRDRAVFASCLFFALQDPRNVSDADGRYRVADKVFEKPDFRYRTVFSGWDVFRSEMPLLGLLRPKDLSDTVNSLLATRLATGRKWLPVWDLFGCDSACMLGNPAISAILEAHAEGIRTFDANEALAACVSTSHADVRGMPTRGYANSWMALSTTLELAYASWCTGALAERLGKPEMATPYYDISCGYTNCWCRKVDWMRSRSPDGGWLKWEGLTTKWQGAIECNPYQQGWFVPHDPEGLMNLCGGPRRFAERLESFMRQSPGRFASNAYYNHSNEPVHLIPFLFHHADRPDLTQKWTRRICANAYDIGPRGLCGNEDEGQMSAWYVLCAMGLHPSCPGAGTWMITSPLFSKVTICLDQDYYKGRFFTVLANGNSESNIYIQSAKLNGKPLDRLWLNYDEVTCGGELELQMGPKPPTVNWMRPPNPLATVR